MCRVARCSVPWLPCNKSSPSHQLGTPALTCGRRIHHNFQAQSIGSRIWRRIMSSLPQSSAETLGGFRSKAFRGSTLRFKNPVCILYAVVQAAGSKGGFARKTGRHRSFWVSGSLTGVRVGTGLGGKGWWMDLEFLLIAQVWDPRHMVEGLGLGLKASELGSLGLGVDSKMHGLLP